MLIAEWLGTATLILTPKLIGRFGASPHSRALLSANSLYEEALNKSFRPVTRSKTVVDFKKRVQKSILSYSKQYDQILYELVTVLGPSRFKVEYVKQITQIGRELHGLPFASLDLSELFRRHVACCMNASANYEQLFEEDSKLDEVESLLRTTNFGLTLLLLVLDGVLSGSIWIMSELKSVTSSALQQMESMPEMRVQAGQLAGSLIIAEGELDLISDPRKSR